MEVMGMRSTALTRPVIIFVLAVAFISLSVLCLLYYVDDRIEEVKYGWSKGKQEDGGATARSCDLFEGRWVWDESYPLYESRDCSFLMDEGFQCTENGRPDRLYTKWRWQPTGCNIPRFDAKNMLEKLRNKRVVFVGDSIGRNQWESLLCMLASTVSDKKSIYEVSGNPITKHKGSLVFKFKDYNCTVEYYRSPFLVLHSRAPPQVPKKVNGVLRVDIMDWRSTQWRDADVLVLNAGHWWNYDKTLKSGIFFQEGNKVKVEMSVESAYLRSIKTLFNWIQKEVNTSKTQVIFRTYSPTHFRNGTWKTGGGCHLETLPELASLQQPTEEWAHFMKPLINFSLNYSTRSPMRELEILNITQMTYPRKDAHLTLYYNSSSSHVMHAKEDCSHWCLPGVPDAWNELLYALFLRWESDIHRTAMLSTNIFKMDNETNLS